MKETLDFIVGYSLGDLASVFGVLVGLVGFAITISNTIRSRRAAEQAREAATLVKDRLSQANTIADLSSALAIMDEVKRLHRQKAWAVLPDRYSQLKLALISSKTQYPSFSDEHRAMLQGAIQQVAIIERQIEVILSEGEDSVNLDVPKLNQTISKQSQNLIEVIIFLQREISG